MKRIQEDKVRSEKVYAMRYEGKTYEQIGKVFGICKTRAKQIFIREHVRRMNLGKTLALSDGGSIMKLCLPPISPEIESS
jgi:hypothetical protein